MVVVGADVNTSTPDTFLAVDEVGRKLGEKQFTNPGSWPGSGLT